MEEKNFKNGDIVTYDNYNTIAIYKELDNNTNDSGDITYKCYVAKVDNRLYWGSLVISDDIRLATDDEKLIFFNFLNESTWKLNRELFKLKYHSSENDG